MIVEPAFDRGGDVERQFEIHGIGGNAVDDQSGRQILSDKADGERNERARGEAAETLKRQNCWEIGRVR